MKLNAKKRLELDDYVMLRDIPSVPGAKDTD